MTGLDRLENLGVRQVHLPEAAERLAADEADDVPFRDADGAGFEFADAELGPLQIDEDADRAGELGFDLADDGVCVANHLGRGVTHIDAEHVRSGLEQRADLFFVVGGRTERGDDLDPAVAPH